MFDIGWRELVVIGIVALIAIGPKELPGALRTAGQWIGKVRRMAGEFQGQFQEAMREAEMADLKKQVDEITTAATSFDPLATANKEIEKAVSDATTPATPPLEPAAPSTEPGATPPAPETGAASVPAPEVTIPAPEPAPPVSAKDFATAEPVPPKDGGGRAA